MSLTQWDIASLFEQSSGCIRDFVNLGGGIIIKVTASSLLAFSTLNVLNLLRAGRTELIKSLDSSVTHSPFFALKSGVKKVQKMCGKYY